MTKIIESKKKLDHIINISRTDMYKPIQIAEVLHNSRINQSLDVNKVETYRNASKQWRDDVTRRLLGKVCTSSARFQDNLWDENAMPSGHLIVLDTENKRLDGVIEYYIYYRFIERQKLVASIIQKLDIDDYKLLRLEDLLALFTDNEGLRRSIDKAYEIITYGLFETIVCALEAEILIRVPDKNTDLLEEFNDLAQVLLGVNAANPTSFSQAHIYRVGVTNAADRGLDMWANFGPAIQVKHLTLKPNLAERIVDQVESDAIVIVCKDAEANVIQSVVQQISWGQRVRGIVKESDLISWYEKCLRGKFSRVLGQNLLDQMKHGFAHEFPHVAEVVNFCKERGYSEMKPSPLWEV